MIWTAIALFVVTTVTAVTAATASSPMFPPSTADAPPGPGIPLTLAEDRARRVSNLRYDLELTIPQSQSDRLRGTIIVRFALSDASRALSLDFAPADGVTATRVAGSAVTLQRVPDHVIVPPEHLRNGDNEIALDFVAGDASLNRNPEFLYSLFVPARAHLAIPCFDQPDLKARWTLELDIPSAWQAVSNGTEVERREDSGRIRLRYAETQPLPTYLFAFAAGRFQVETGERHGRTFRMLHRETDAEKVARNRDKVFDLHDAALQWLERYTGIPYPWGKFDFLLVPSFQFGGMEHAGSIFYNASALLLDPSATQNQHLGRASLIAHETAHMWFGDLVTMRWFNDVWMKEVFANFMAAKIVNPSFPELNHDLRFLFAHYPTAYDTDRTPGTNAIRQRLDNLNEAGSLYGAIIYQKAPIVMRQLEGILGETTFRDGLQEYLKKYSFSNATWADLVSILDARTPEDLAAWSRAWVEEAGRPIITTELKVTGGRIAELAFLQRDPYPRRGLIWNQRLQIAVSQPDGVRTLAVRMNGQRTAVPEAAGLAAPGFVLPTGGGIGYGGFVLDSASIADLMTHLSSLQDPLTRGAAWVTIWEQMLDGRVQPQALLDLVVRSLPRETDEQNIQRILNYTQQAYWRFLGAEARSRVTPTLETILKNGLESASSSSLKSAWFSAIRDTASSRPMLEWLEGVWEKKLEVPGLTLAEPDFISLALELAVREVPRWSEILDEQARRIQNPDRKARFEFVRPALSPDQAVRDSFFESLKDVGNRRREPWVLEAVAYLHHPLRAASAEKYIPASLGLLQEIQRTGDIFFPRRWTDATLGGHNSPGAAVMVKTFLDALPASYPDRLRRVVLASSDDLFRATGVAR